MIKSGVACTKWLIRLRSKRPSAILKRISRRWSAVPTLAICRWMVSTARHSRSRTAVSRSARQSSRLYSLQIHRSSLHRSSLPSQPCRHYRCRVPNLITAMRYRNVPGLFSSVSLSTIWQTNRLLTRLFTICSGCPATSLCPSVLTTLSWPMNLASSSAAKALTFRITT